MELIYKDVDIYHSVSINKCIYDSYGEQQSDTLRIVFNDGNDRWDGWRPQKGDKISVILGACRSGDMYVINVQPRNGQMLLFASSVPERHNDKSNKSWQNVHFMQICEEIAGRHNLSCEFHGVKDQIYAYVRQQNREDFIFLEERCVLEGCAFLVYDNRLIVYSEAELENASTNNKLIIPNGVKFDYKDESPNVYSKCILKNGAMTGMYEVANTTKKTLTKVMNLKISSQAEADRYAKNLLRFENKKMTSGVCVSDTFLGGYAAGTLVELQTTGVSSWNGPVIMNHVQHDLVKAKTKLYFRKTLEGY
ncbi:MAG: hypothetical protein NC231_12230 [Bacillus sp. (in: Bacteria)]|nr:hypothetical protein [Bacillus sp. (in: firmicutes)]MCM1427131.1 hypothetical protein [Eubacterium sp.]